MEIFAGAAPVSSVRRRRRNRDDQLKARSMQWKANVKYELLCDIGLDVKVMCDDRPI